MPGLASCEVWFANFRSHFSHFREFNIKSNCTLMMRLILYSKPGCHLCEGLQEKLEQIESLKFQLEVRDITERDDWFQAYQYEVPVLFKVESQQKNYGGDAAFSPEEQLPRPSPRCTVPQLEQMLQKYLEIDRSQ
jgi:glutaredoxin